jgi:hypothetical protein
MARSSSDFPLGLPAIQKWIQRSQFSARSGIAKCVKEEFSLPIDVWGTLGQKAFNPSVTSWLQGYGRALVVVDDSTREGPALMVDTSLTPVRQVARAVAAALRRSQRSGSTTAESRFRLL